MLNKLQANFDELALKHEAYTALIDEDSEFEEEEAWPRECQENFMDVEYRAKIIDLSGSDGISVMPASDTPRA